MKGAGGRPGMFLAAGVSSFGEVRLSLIVLSLGALQAKGFTLLILNLFESKIIY